MIRRLGLGRVLVFLVAAGIVALVVGLLISRNDDSKSCVNTTVAGARDNTVPNSEAFAVFIAEQEEGPLPLADWTLQSESGDTSTYVSKKDGDWHVTVARGAVREYGGCPS